MTVLKNTDETDGYEKVRDCTTYEQFVEIKKPMLIGPNSGYSTIQLSGFTKDGYFVVAGLANSLEHWIFQLLFSNKQKIDFTNKGIGFQTDAFINCYHHYKQ